MIESIRQILKVFEENHVFDEGVELIGSWCFQLYQKHLGAKSFPLRTQDIDFLIPNPYKGKEHKYFIHQLEDLGFNCDFRKDGSLYLWNAELKIEFITPEKGKGADKAIKVKKLGLSAIPLRYVNILLEDPITIDDNGIKILAPNPNNFCLHKLIIASKRRNIEKGLKDIQQAVCASVIVDTKAVRKLFDSLPKKWQTAIVKMLQKARYELPLLSEEVERLAFTLQND